MIRESVPIATPAALEACRSWRFFFHQMVFRGGNELCNHLKGDMTVQRCKISDESIRHALPMGEHIHIFTARAAIYLRVTVIPVSTFAPKKKRVMDVEWGGSWFFWERAFRGLRHPWIGEEMGCMADFPLLHCLKERVRARHLPGTFWIAHKRNGVNNMAKCCALLEEPPAPD